MNTELNPFKLQDIAFIHGSGGFEYAVNNYIDKTFGDNVMSNFKVVHDKEPFYPAVVSMTTVWHYQRFDHVACVWYTPEEVKAKLNEMLDAIEESIKYHNEKAALTQTVERKPVQKPEFPKNTIQSEANTPERPVPPPIQTQRESWGGPDVADKHGNRPTPPGRTHTF